MKKELLTIHHYFIPNLQAIIDVSTERTSKLGEWFYSETYLLLTWRIERGFTIVE